MTRINRTFAKNFFDFDYIKLYSSIENLNNPVIKKFLQKENLSQVNKYLRDYNKIHRNKGKNARVYLETLKGDLFEQNFLNVKVHKDGKGTKNFFMNLEDGLKSFDDFKSEFYQRVAYTIEELEKMISKTV